MTYFQELPNIEYISPYSDKDSNSTTILAKNIFKRAKIRSDLSNVITGFTYYTIGDNERPDQIAKKVYGDDELDWVILITNNITNIQGQWPLDNNSFYKYLLQKYKSDEAIQLPHHYETIETRDEYNRLVIPGSLTVSPELDINFTTSSEIRYKLLHFPSVDLDPKVNINLTQYVNVYDQTGTATKLQITNIQDSYSYLNVYKQGESTPTTITITNELTTWPASWNGNLEVDRRDGSIDIIPISDELTNNKIYIGVSLYRISLVNNIPTFSFYPAQYSPVNGMEVQITTTGYEVNYLNTDQTPVSLKGKMQLITNYEYEEQIQNKKRNILILKPEYLSAFISDFKEIMRYKPSSNYINSNTKSVYNPSMSGV